MGGEAVAVMSNPNEQIDEAEDDSGIGGDEPFCEHGNLLWSEDCDECMDARTLETDGDIQCQLTPTLRR